MGSKDVKDIVGLAKDDIAKSKSIRLNRPPMKRPTGMSREVFNLIAHGPNEENLFTAIPTKKLEDKHQMKKMILFRKVRKWKWKEFENEGRADGFKLSHWEREDRNPAEPYIFARMNKRLNLPRFSQEEYERHFQAEKWTHESTEYLFDLCERFDLRWAIISSRFEREKYGDFSMEDLKERFYRIYNILKRDRCLEGPIYSFDAENERKRKQQLEMLWSRTEDEIKEEELLRAQMRRIESRRKEREKRTQDLQRLINVVERSASPEPNGSTSGSQVRSSRRAQKQQKTQLMSAHLFSNDVPNLRFAEFKSAGPHLRSQEMKIPSNVGQKKLKAIEAAIEKYQIPLALPAYEETVRLFNDLRARVVLAQELRNALQGTQ
ncbi:unnamed protein product [Bursaphelenchus xylophilus]|uniref:DNA methyltransferase 1-associated protein 1 n=1 Tax=Bursaphelenchus xylophilus TaxID=6326 RepID=A0A1I7S7X8_BURXY|nr:unnamed protein product [Bursaphelenchus xylophilus]CAG9087203.1 unnamed protein product [Bursaphelenchus xylophilus]